MAIEDHDSIEEAYEAAAKGLVKKSSEADRQVEFYSLDELDKARKQKAADNAAANGARGLYFTRCVPPPTG